MISTLLVGANTGYSKWWEDLSVMEHTFPPHQGWAEASTRQKVTPATPRLYDKRFDASWESRHHEPHIIFYITQGRSEMKRHRR
jgi:hypothetical protein